MDFLGVVEGQRRWIRAGRRYGNGIKGGSLRRAAGRTVLEFRSLCERRRRDWFRVPAPHSRPYRRMTRLLPRFLPPCGLDNIRTRGMRGMPGSSRRNAGSWSVRERSTPEAKRPCDEQSYGVKLFSLAQPCLFPLFFLLPIHGPFFQLQKA